MLICCDRCCFRFESGDTRRWIEGSEKSLDTGSLEVIRFTGHERDLRAPESNDDLDYMHARYYNPYLGRFLSVDPVGGNGGDTLSWNRYSYVLNRPISYIDPDGREVMSIAVGAGAFSGAGYAILSTGALGVVIVTGGVVMNNVGSGYGDMTVTEWWALQLHTVFSKGGKQRIRDTGLHGLSDGDIERELADPNTPRDRRKKLKREQKARGQRNKQKRRSGEEKKDNEIVVHPLINIDNEQPDQQLIVEEEYGPPPPPTDDKEDDYSSSGGKL